MSITINNQKIPYYFYDDEDSLLNRFALMNGSHPSFYRIVTKEYELAENVKLNVEDIRSVIRKKDLYNEEHLSQLATLFPKLTKKDIMLLFLNQTFGDESKESISHEISSKLDILKKIDKSFSSVSTVQEMMVQYNKTIAESIESLRQIMNEYEKNIKLMEGLPPVNCEDLKIEEITLDIKIKLKKGITLVDIFDSINVSEKIPFVYFYKGNSLCSKVYKNIIPPEEWIENISPVKSRLHFKILNSKKALTPKNINKIYSDGWWDDNDNIEVSMSNNYLLDEILDQTYIQKNLFSSLDENIGEYRILKSSQSSVRSIFKINNFGFNKVILSDIIDNSKIMSFFLFLNEYQYISTMKSLTAITKNRFMVYFNPGNLGDIKNSISLTLTPQTSDDERAEWVNVRISKSKNFQKAESVRRIFCLLMSLYLNDYESTFKIYEKLLPEKIKTMQKYKVRSKKGVKEDKKTGKRLQELKNQRPQTFRSGYSGLCQPMSHQPYIVPPSKVETIKKIYGEHKIMEYKDPNTNSVDYYACEPREDGEERGYIFPGLRKNTIAGYKDTVPFVPCCFSDDQYTKKASELRKQLASKKVNPEDDKYKFIEVEDVNDIGHILGYNKSVPIGRFGQLPYYMNFILKSAGYQEIEKGKQMVYPIFRYGMLQTPDSFFHCLEKVTNLKYATLPYDGRIKRIREVRKILSELDLSIVKQEFYDYSDEDIKKILLDENAYIDPGMWISLAEKYYNCNIFIFQISPEFPNGAMVYPRFSDVYLSNQKQEDLPFVFIMKNTTENEWPFQCELFAKFTPFVKKGQKISFNFSYDDEFVKEVIRTFEKSNNVYILFDDSKVKYKPVNRNSPIFKNVKYQYIDRNGKTRILFYDDICLTTSPIPPLDIPVKSKSEIFHTDLQVCEKFIQKYHLKKTSQRVIGNNTDGIFVEFTKDNINYGFIPINHKGKISGLEKFTKPVNDLNPCEYDDNSRLEILNKNKKIAMIMMQYTLFEYSFDPDSFSKDSFIIIENYSYDNIYELGKFLIRWNNIVYRDKKLIVCSEEMREKLLSFLKIELLNDKQKVIRYKERYVIKDYYSKLKDFRHTPNQYIFINFTGLREWIEKQTTSNFKITYVLKPQNYETSYFYKNYNISKTLIFLVQNVNGGTLEKALGLCEEWNTKQINLGFRSEKITNSPVNYNIYTSSGLIKKKILDKSSDEKLMVIKIKNMYSALLPFHTTKS